MSFLLSRLLGSSVAKTETKVVASGSSGLLTKVGIGAVGLSVASPLLGGLSQIPGIGSVFQPASTLANTGLGAVSSGVGALGSTASGIGSVLSNPIYLLAGGGLLLVFLMKK